MPPRLSSRLSRRYLYPQLDPRAKTIRLLELLPADFSELPIHCQLVERKLSPTLSYKALSYSWQNEHVAPDEAIFCNSSPVYISANLHAALRRFRRPDEVVMIWVDAICINQQDDAERAYQVSIMRDIYQFCSEVLIWLGESGPDDEMGDWIWESPSAVGDELRETRDNPNVVQWSGDKDDIPKLKAYFSATAKDRASRFDVSEKCDIFGTFCVLHLLASGVPVDKIWHLRHVSYSTGLINGLNAIMKKAWWRRIWVVQETVVAKSPMVFYGNMCAPWRMFALAAVEYDTSRVKDNVEGFLSLLKIGQSLMEFTRVIMEIESTRQTWQRFEPLVPMTLLRKFRSRLATDPRDKVFAVLGLIKSWGTEKSGQAMKAITPDYSIRDYRLFFDTTILLIRNTRSLVALAGTLQGGDDRFQMPSWITDWNCPPTVNEHIRLGNIQLYSAADYLSGSVALHGHSVLEVQGYLFDKVEYVGRVLENNQGTSRSRLTVREWQQALPILPDIVSGGYIAGGSLYAAFWRTLCSDLEFVQSSRGSKYVREFRRLPEEIDPSDEAFEHWLTVDEHSRRRTSLIGGIWVEPTNGEIETESKNAFQYLLECASGGRRFFRTRSGYIGTGPPDMRMGDKVAVLLGSRVPFILREDDKPRRCAGYDINVLFSERASYQAGKGAAARDDEKFHCYVMHRHCHRVVGDAYVHGMMRGDVKRTNQWNDAPIYLV